ncbi:hypothetical protein V5E97_07405 [Singulisphaera sp. Ch08]|uniref:Uncharacterized protein n=1 Tax=Singulisphaera sp. Ch08 TaxID=3120278 RepID=A0AAU7CLG2_9BACT
MKNTLVVFAMVMMATLVFAADRPSKPSSTKTKAGGLRKPTPFQVKYAQAANQKVLIVEASLTYQYVNYVGTQIAIDPQFKLPVDVAGLLRKADWKSPDRLAYFDWLKAVPDLRCNGWDGILTKADAIEGGYVINVTFKPILASPEGSHKTASAFNEVYELSNQGLKYVSGSGNSLPPMLILE